jgi:hypothetical protein
MGSTKCRVRSCTAWRERKALTGEINVTMVVFSLNLSTFRSTRHFSPSSAASTSRSHAT